MYVSYNEKDWNETFLALAKGCNFQLKSIMETHNVQGPSLRDSALLVAQFALSNSLFEALEKGETSPIHPKLIKDKLYLTCKSQLDPRTTAYGLISQELAKFELIGQIPLRLLRSILQIGSGIPHQDNDKFITDLLKSVNSIKIQINKIITETPPADGELQMSLNISADLSQLECRKSQPIK
jgi:hypothetical protein